MFAALETLRPLVRSARALAVMTPRLPDAAFGGVPGVVRALAGHRPHGAALRTLEGTLTWAEVEREADRRAAFWRTQGLNAGDAVALLLGNHVEVLLQQIALGRIGAVGALVDHTLRGRGLQHTLDAARARAAVVDTEGALAIGSIRFRGALGVWSGLDAPASAGTRELLPALPPASPLPVPAVRVGLDDVYAYVFTSGTTGLPKAARIRHHRYLLGGAGFQAFAMWLDPADVIFTPLPLHHSSAQIVGFSTALAAQCCFAFSERFSATRYWDEARQVGATVGLYVGELCRYLVQTPEASGDRAHGVHTMLGNGLRADVWPQSSRRVSV
jgi:fatty-acyl-CoA synthase